MSDNHEWEKLVRDVERAHVERAQGGPAKRQRTNRAVVMPNVLPPYMIKKAPPPPKASPLKVLVPLFLLLALGAGAWFIFKDSFNEPVKEAEVAAFPGNPMTADPGAQFGASGGNPTYQTAVRSALENRLRPVNFFETFGIQPMDMKRLSDIKSSWDGKRLMVYAVMHARLDETTEKRWREAGLFKAERTPLSPFLRTIQLSKAGDLELLYDWHLEGILLKLPPPPPPIPAQ